MMYTARVTVFLNQNRTDKLFMGQPGIPLINRSNFNPARINNHMTSKVWDEIIYHFPNVNSAAIEVGEWINNYIRHFLLYVITNLCWD